MDSPISLVPFMVVWIYLSHFPISMASNIIKRDDIYEEDDPLKVHRCNFADLKVITGEKLRGESSDDLICTVPLNGRSSAFTYSCKGVSQPWNCPKDVIYKGQATALSSLFNTCNIQRDVQIAKANPPLYTALVSQHRQAFTAHCMCEHDNGKVYTMIITSGVSGMLPSRFLTWFMVATFAFTFLHIP